MLFSDFMKVEFRQVKAGGSEFGFSAPATDLELDVEGFKFPEPIEVKLTATKSGDEVIFQGNVSTLIEAECARCLELFEKRISSRMQFVIQFLDVNGTEDTGDDDFMVLPKTQEDYDISSRVREAIMLELPYKPLCENDCKGLCSMCGENLNETDCGCTQDKTDERWDTLRQLFEE
jgi:uncharacterized protein